VVAAGEHIRGDSVGREILEEYEAHLAEAANDGVDTAEAKRGFRVRREAF
jgi:hypothetical protein